MNVVDVTMLWHSFQSAIAYIRQEEDSGLIGPPVLDSL